MKPAPGPRRLIYTGQQGVRCDVVIDDTGLSGPMGRMEYMAGPPDGYVRPAPPMPEIALRFTDATTGFALVGPDTLPFNHGALPS